MPSSTSKNLGQVSSLHIGDTAPDNHNMIWIDTSVNPSVRKIYDYSLNEWTELSLEYVEKKINELVSITYSTTASYSSIIYGTYISSSIFIDSSSNVVVLDTNTLYLDISATASDGVNKAYIYKDGVDGGLIEYISSEKNYTIEIYVKYWTNTTPNNDDSSYWYNPDNKELRYYVSNEWKISKKQQYAIYKYDNNVYIWNGQKMMLIGILDSKSIHDNTLIGDGTEENPLRINETGTNGLNENNKYFVSLEDKAHLDTLYALLASDDSDTVVNTIGEILQIFQNYPEGVDLVNVLSNKVDKTSSNTLSIAVADWSTTQLADGTWKCEKSIAGLLATDWVEGVFANSDSDIYSTAQILPQPTVADGLLTIYAKTAIPTAAMTLTYKIFSGTGSGGGLISCLIGGSSGTKKFYLNKSTFNGITDPAIILWDKDIKFSAGVLASNCSGFTITIGTTTYTEITITDVTLTAGTEAKVTNMTVVTGQTSANAYLPFKEI